MAEKLLVDQKGPWFVKVEPQAAYVFHVGGLAASATSFPEGPPSDREIKHLTRLVEDANYGYNIPPSWKVTPERIAALEKALFLMNPEQPYTDEIRAMLKEAKGEA